VGVIGMYEDLMDDLDQKDHFLNRYITVLALITIPLVITLFGISYTQEHLPSFDINSILQHKLEKNVSAYEEPFKTIYYTAIVMLCAVFVLLCIILGISTSILITRWGIRKIQRNMNRPIQQYG
jgi:uncharacterized membrane protein